MVNIVWIVPSNNTYRFTLISYTHIVQKPERCEATMKRPGTKFRLSYFFSSSFSAVYSYIHKIFKEIIWRHDKHR